MVKATRVTVCFRLSAPIGFISLICEKEVDTRPLDASDRGDRGLDLEIYEFNRDFTIRD